MKIVIVGAGAAGLVTARHAVESGHDCELLEMRPQLGGTWLYTDEVGRDEFGYPVYSATYKMNLPRVLMRFEDHPADLTIGSKEYGTHSDMLGYLKKYAEHFDLHPLIKLNRFVKKVLPLDEDGGGKWRVISEDKVEKKEVIGIYDVVILCVGNCNEPFTPDLPGIENFGGRLYHSREYRTARGFAGKNVLVIGAGASGLDLAFELSSTSAKVVHSHHSPLITTKYPENVEVKPDVRYLREKEIEFEDGTTFPADVIYYGTGYKYCFPFLDRSCGITIEENYIQPLYKHMIHMERPTMCFMGVPIIVCAFRMFDLQARFYMRYLEGAFELPTLEEMKGESEKERKLREEVGYKKTEGHKMLDLQESYYEELARIANVEALPPVFTKIFKVNMERFYGDVANFRNDTYEVLDEESFTHVVSK